MSMTADNSPEFIEKGCKFLLYIIYFLIYTRSGITQLCPDFQWPINKMRIYDAHIRQLSPVYIIWRVKKKYSSSNSENRIDFLILFHSIHFRLSILFYKLWLHRWFTYNSKVPHTHLYVLFEIYVELPEMVWVT